MINTKIMNFEIIRNLFILVIKNDVSQPRVAYYKNTRSDCICPENGGKKKSFWLNRFNHNLNR